MRNTYTVRTQPVRRGVTHDKVRVESSVEATTMVTINDENAGTVQLSVLQIKQE